ncbi:ABC transporter permease subunit [Cuniculiplasma sp. SKW3]|uniref:ABC transporter permease subunit n=1 Tax=Cuniculiplasma sp. SKW3 TaxID=3400170 RepID=UPI003FCFAF5B
MRNSSGKRSGNRTYKIVRNSLTKKAFALIVVLFIITSSMLAFANTPKENNSIGASRQLEYTEVYYNGTYYVTAQFYHATCGRPFSKVNIEVSFSPIKSLDGFSSGNKTHIINMTLNQSGMGKVAFRSDKMWLLTISNSHHGGSVFPEKSSNYSYMFYTAVFDRGFAYKGYLEMIYASSNFTKAPMRQYRLLESDGAVVNLGYLGGFYHKVINLSYPSTTTDIEGILEDKVNGTWTSTNLVTSGHLNFYLLTKGGNNEVSSANNYTLLLYSVPSVYSLSREIFLEYLNPLSIFFLFFLIILSIFTFGIPVSSGQAEFYLSMPFDRRHYFIGKYLTVIIVMLATTLITLFVSYETTEFIDGTFPPLHYILRLFTLFTLLGLTGISLTFMFASRLRSLTKIIAYPIISIMFMYYIFGDLIRAIYGLLNVISPGFSENASTVNTVSMIDPFRVFSLYVSSKFPPLGGALIVISIFSFTQAILLILPWAVIPLVIGLILWRRRF